MVQVAVCASISPPSDAGAVLITRYVGIVRIAVDTPPCAPFYAHCFWWRVGLRPGDGMMKDGQPSTWGIIIGFSVLCLVTSFLGSLGVTPDNMLPALTVMGVLTIIVAVPIYFIIQAIKKK